MLVMLIGIIETSRMALFDQKLKAATFQIADLATQNEQVTQSLLTEYANAINKIMEPFDFNGTVIFTSVASADNGRDADDVDTARKGGSLTPDMDAVSTVDADVYISPERQKIGCKGGCVIWQFKPVGTHASKIGRVGSQAIMPNEYEVFKTQVLGVVEVVAVYEPMLGISRNFISAFAPRENYSVAVYKPRQDSDTWLKAPQ